MHIGPENLKKSRPNKLLKSNKSISPKKIIDQIPFFAISKMAKNKILTWENCQKCNFMKKRDLFDFTSFFSWTSLSFLACCAMVRSGIASRSVPVFLSDFNKYFHNEFHVIQTTSFVWLTQNISRLAGKVKNYNWLYVNSMISHWFFDIFHLLLTLSTCDKNSTISV